MIKLFRVWLAKRLRNQMMPITPSKINDSVAIKFNHLQSVILTKGKIKLEWWRILQRKNPKLKT